MWDSPAILAADDNADDIELLHRSFDKAGFANQFFAVSSGQAVIQYLQGEGEYADRQRFPFPRLVLLDFKMQGITGPEVLQWIRQRPEFMRLPVIVFTGSNYEEDINRAYDLGANSYLVKPQTLNDLIAAVQQIGDFWLRLSRLPDRPSLH